ncbi:MAG TPA: carboxypeptidase-like regulatory domain-containing protein [Actinophytocola sp.]|jgi:hypothetical protein|uniref:carboxypeptidase-like regulatory domain-containing protein n=1 Tax=Actinophytocola sp. TaxID=1872138 RepID=UPI002DFA30E5|nr:carboxypeptidase-like regulatory domain-containing protein [Actinophytocola sp.]
MVTLLLAVGAPTVATADFDTRIVGQVTRTDGTPVAGVFVVVIQVPRGAFGGSATTDANGRYAIGDLNGFGLAYKVEFFYRSNSAQWAHQKTTFEDAEAFTPTDGEDTVVDEVLFPRGTLEVTASDKLTGAPVNHFCAATSGPFGGGGCTDTGTVTLEDLPLGDYRVFATDNENYFSADSAVTVFAGTTTRIHFALEPVAFITATIQDAGTHAPVAFACLQAVGNFGGFGPFSDYCSGSDGQVRIGQLHTGRYRLYVSALDGVHGDQWVGPHGGTGIEFFARPVDVTAGQTVTVPPVQLDGAGSISGTVVDKATGQPARDVCAFTHAGTPTGGPELTYCTKTDGTYTINHVGPYVWPVQFTSTTGGYPWQWSGDQPTQLSARPVTIHIGQNTPLDAHLGPVATVSGRVTRADGRPPLQGVVKAFNAVTGEPVANDALIEQDGTYRLIGVAGPQFVRLEFLDAGGDRVTRWYRDSSSYESATPVPVRSGATVTGIDAVLPQGS